MALLCFLDTVSQYSLLLQCRTNTPSNNMTICEGRLFVLDLCSERAVKLDGGAHELAIDLI